MESHTILSSTAVSVKTLEPLSLSIKQNPFWESRSKMDVVDENRWAFPVLFALRFADMTITELKYQLGPFRRFAYCIFRGREWSRLQVGDRWCFGEGPWWQGLFKPFLILHLRYTGTRETHLHICAYFRWGGVNSSIEQVRNLLNNFNRS